jgi:hypothetical protein
MLERAVSITENHWLWTEGTFLFHTATHCLAGYSIASNKALLRGLSVLVGLDESSTDTLIRVLRDLRSVPGPSHLLASGEEMALGSSAAGTAGTACASLSSSADGARLLSDAALADACMAS